MKTNLLPALLLATAGVLSIQAQEPAAPAALSPKIVCAAPVYDFGETNNTGFIEHDFPIRNEGTLSLEIRGVSATCGCTAVKPSQDVIPPGGEASIRARLDLRGRNGVQIKTITVQSNDPQTPTLSLQLKGTAVQALRAQPPSLFFGRVEPNAVRNRTFDIIAAQGPIQITGVRTDNPGLVVAPVAPEAGADGSSHRFELTLDAALPEGNINGSIFVKTDRADLPELAIPVAAYIVNAAEPAPAVETTPGP
ncbi:MAG TPA: hypothetical protein DCM68_01865 [Verrucomicrobia bacterium]|nr:hypothetical protein [Verrucomicrobiota bacterium]